MLNMKKIVVICAFFCVSLYTSANASEKSKPVGVYFVLSARNLPDTDTLGMGSPDPYVELEYYGGKYTTSKPFITNTSMIANSHNPEWTDIFYLHYHAGGQQSIKFTVFDHNRVTRNKPIGHVTIPVKDLTQKFLDLVLISDKDKPPGKLQIHTRIEGGEPADDLDPRLKRLKHIKNIGGYNEVSVRHVPE